MSEWRVASNRINGKKKYVVHKQIDDNGNREKIGCTFNSYDLAQTVADQMNRKEKEVVT